MLYELDLHGLTVDEALFKADKFIHDAYRLGLNKISIVHGKGTGTLRNAVRSFIARHPLVVSYRRGKDDEGGDGATIVELRSK